MTRLLELIVAIVIVAILALIVGVCLPSTGHIERTATVSKDIRHVYDIFDNFRRFPDYSMLNAYKEGVEYQQSEDKWYGPGASISWTGNGKKGDSPVGHGKLTIASAKPGFDKVEVAGKANIVWDIDNDWHGTDKHFTINLDRTGRQQKLVKITWSYDVDYGWNLINRYAGLYIHGRPDTFIKRSLHNLTNVLAAIPNIRYNDLDPKIVDTPQQPILVVSTQAQRNLTQMGAAADKAEAKIEAAMKELGLKAAGPRIRITTNYGDTKVLFDVAIPIQSDTVTIDGKEYTLTKPHPRGNDLAEAASVLAAANSAPAEAGSSALAEAGSSAPAEAGSVAKADDESANDESDEKGEDIGPQPGDLDEHGRLIITKDVRAMLAFGGKALQGVWYGSPAGVPVTRLRLKAYAETHGYPFDEVAHRLYDKQVRGYGDMGPNGKPLMFDQQFFKIFLPVSDAPEQTPEQAAGMEPRNPFAEPANAASAPANAGSAPASAGSVPAEAGSAPAEAGSAAGEASDGLGPKRPAAAPIGA